MHLLSKRIKNFGYHLDISLMLMHALYLSDNVVAYFVLYITYMNLS
jgi:hypothetical protein